MQKRSLRQPRRVTPKVLSRGERERLMSAV
jgi:hypothetical protein